MRTRYRLHIVNTNTWHRARSVDHALELVDQLVHEGETWRVTRTLGAGDPITVRQGVGRREVAS